MGTKLVHGQKPFEERTDLTKGEIEALRCYRDKNYSQHIWSINPNPNRPNYDCDIINGCLRHNISFKKLLKHEKSWYLSLVKRIHAAIKKSEITERFVVYKGLKNFENLSKFKESEVFTDNGFSSFSTSLSKAKQYAGENEDGRLIYFALVLNKGDNALYIDDMEDEWLVQNRSRYLILGIDYVNNDSFGNAIVYNIERT